MRLRPPVPRPDGQARRRLHRGAVAGHLHRPEVGLPQPAVHGRHDHRGLRLPPPAVRPHRRAPLPGPRRAAGAPDAPADRRPARPSCPRAPASRCWRRSCGAARASTTRCWPTSRPRATSGPGSTARRPTSPSSSRATSGWPATSSTRSRSSSTGSSCATASSAGSPTRWRRRCSLAEGVVEIELVPREGEEVEAETLRSRQHLACPVGFESYEELAPRNFSFNSPYGACEHVRRPGHHVRGRPRAGRAQPGSVGERGRHLAVEHRSHAVLPAACSRRSPRPTRSTSTSRGRS